MGNNSRWILLGAAVLAAGVGVAMSTKNVSASGGDYVCYICGEHFGSQGELQDHVVDVHPGARIPVIVDWGN